MKRVLILLMVLITVGAAPAAVHRNAMVEVFNVIIARTTRQHVYLAYQKHDVSVADLKEVAHHWMYRNVLQNSASVDNPKGELPNTVINKKTKVPGMRVNIVSIRIKRGDDIEARVEVEGSTTIEGMFDVAITRHPPLADTVKITPLGETVKR